MNISARAKKFAQEWKDRGSERSESQPFWLTLLRAVLGIEKPENYIRFEKPVQLSHKSFIDGFIDSTHVMIEQKSRDKDLNEPIKQSDGTFLTPYQQAKRYAAELPYSKRPRWIIACNFAEFHIYDLENPQAKPEILLLENLDKEYYRLNFMIDKTDKNIKRELELSIKAGEIVGKLYDALRKQYINPDSEESLKSLNKLCVRLVFCLYAESAGIFGKHKMFREYLNHFRGHNVRLALIELFKILNQKEEERDPYLDEKLKVFPYVNGGLFEDDKIEIPNLTDEILNLLLENASGEFNWSGISPTIFGAVFESTLNPITRRSGGMHYTSIENIHKLINPLFLDDLKTEFEEIKIIKSVKNRQKKLYEFQEKMSKLVFLDPACGSGNFLTETYLSLRRLENEILKEIIGTQITLGEISNPIKVTIGQFYGIEVNDFAVTVAKTALWIAESQMMAETSEIVHRELDFLPLKSYTNIEEGNALRVDWQKIVSKVDYIFGNPPFVGRRYRTKEQVNDISKFFTYKDVDYVACWYAKAADYIKQTKTRCAFVSTNSITQGEQVSAIWTNLLKDIHIDFAYKTFKWISESKKAAAVYCVIIGFSYIQNESQKFIFNGDEKISAKNINGYLIDAPNIFINSRSKPICDVPAMCNGNMPADGKNLSMSDDEYKIFIQKEPAAQKFIKRLVGAEEFINNKIRWCLWLVDAKPNELKRMPLVMKRIEAVKKFRLNSTFKNIADRPHLFRDLKNPKSFIIIPSVSSERRKYIPIGFLDDNFITTTQVQMIPNANLYHFGILTSSVHMAWTRTVCGRLEMRYRYSKDIVYNNFVWCAANEKQRQEIEQTAAKIIEVRKKYPESSLADLYNDTIMPAELRKAHQANDKAVMKAYGFNFKMTESEIVAELMKMYATFAQ